MKLFKSNRGRGNVTRKAILCMPTSQNGHLMNFTELMYFNNLSVYAEAKKKTPIRINAMTRGAKRKIDDAAEIFLPLL